MTRRFWFRLCWLACFGSPLAFAQDGATGTEVSGGSAVSTWGDDRWDQVVRLMEKGRQADLLRAREDLQAGVGKDASDAHGWYLLGIAHLHLGAPADAADALARATQIAPEVPEVWLALGEAERQVGDPDTALRRFQKGLSLHPTHGGLLEARVRALRLAGRLDEATAAAKDALKEHALRLGLYHEMGHAWLAKGNIALASFVFEKAETVPGGPESAMVHTNVGWVRHLNDQRYGARRSLDRALEIDDRYLPALIARARLAYEDRDFDLMKSLLERAVEQAEGNAEVWRDLGVAYRGVGEAEEAMRAFKKARALDPGELGALFNLGILHADDLKDYDVASETLRAYLDEGGVQREQAEGYLEDIAREQARVERRRQMEQRRKEREAERERQKKLLEKDKQDDPEGEGGSPWEGAP